jgi:hypothetical protein
MTGQKLILVAALAVSLTGTELSGQAAAVRSPYL